ncbi:MAG: formimidoylglutamate deiminase [Gammaproteobacteria bacterium]|nr:formimidoylglutamate deiminase [Gammaproteobacteria bacterium]
MKLFAPRALLHSGWARDVLIEIDAAGRLAALSPDSACPEDAERLAGPVIPGMGNLHSHAFQRAFAGFSEIKGPGEDSFWSWRQIMYDFVARITPEQVQTIAEQLYIEMLKAGYTAVGEFHYLHHGPGGEAYTPFAELSNRVIAAAEGTGIAITHLPVLYAHSGFGGLAPTEGQRRFINRLDEYAVLMQDLFAAHGGKANVRIGMAPHSLRAVTPEELREALAVLDALDATAPVHIHIAEQVKEVQDCMAWSGARPVAWLLDNVEVDARWCLVHATHLDEAERQGLAKSRAVAGLCLTTEANLGDGIFPAREFLAEGGHFGIGSDSHISVSAIEELRLLEYGQRLLHKSRAVLADAECPSVGRRLWTGAARGGAQALGLEAGILAAGFRADLLVLDEGVPALMGKDGDTLLDALVFAGNVNPIRDVMVLGRWQVREGRHAREEEVLAKFAEVQRQVRGK